ncbi:hypothetical protein Ais01nite_52040 [Asanoa ishikariensis]|uniref:DUF3515 domain-containing protein n=1 Tax=Asanoa ishikariensis TaxID=137265 RepID=A0A1H3RK63_9ACTN|nr:DUF3515 family protein [Asanoa ishikariensis]GIF67169.1 hypothetical protein Ais01nite_52040 [Asanoa ishikariensis]SDZ25628.1 Protein of unknown function [Asanoa ishikariensis]
MDRSTRQAALLATAVAIPLAVIVVLLSFWRFSPDEPKAAPATSAPAPQATTPVTMTAPTLSPRATTLCRALLSQLPQALRDRAQRPVTAGTEQNAAYGDPAITLACGVPAPTFPQTDLVSLLDKVCWHDVVTPDATVLTTVDREVTIQVTVPKSYEAAGQWAIVFSNPIIETVPKLATPPAGCAGSA